LTSLGKAFTKAPHFRPLEVCMELRERVQNALDLIRPALQRDGGDVELVDVTPEGIVKVRLQGACKGCPMSQMTLKMGIERMILKEVPEIQSVEAV
jgi:Fe-S cluster biogenesis protein NfuA